MAARPSLGKTSRTTSVDRLSQSETPNQPTGRYQTIMDETVTAAFTRFLQQPGRSLSTKAKYRHKFKLFLEQHGQTAVTSITSTTIEQWFHYLEEKRGYSEGHLSFHRSCHKAFWGWVGLDVVKVNRYAETPTAVITATDEEIKRLLSTCSHMWATSQQQRDAAIVTLGTAGLRRSNIERVRLSEAVQSLANPLTVNGRILHILHTKGKEPMDAVLDEQRAAILRRYVTSRPATRHDRLFINLNRLDGRYLEPLTEKAYEKARRKVCKLAGLRLVTFQEMRRWLGTKIAKTNNVLTAAQALGHKSGVSVILNHYYNPDRELVQTAVMEAYRS
jgi:integrase